MVAIIRIHNNFETEPTTISLLQPWEALVIQSFAVMFLFKATQNLGNWRCKTDCICRTTKQTLNLNQQPRVYPTEKEKK